MARALILISIIFSGHIFAKPTLKAQDLLIYALKYGYGAIEYFPNPFFEKVFSKLRNIKPTTVSNLCVQIDDTLWEITDDHLIVRHQGSFCGKLRKKKFFSKPAVGNNLLSRKDPKSSAVTYRKVNKNKIPVLSISRFPDRKSKSWDGFIDTLKQIKEESKALIVDMRGNGGGDDTISEEWAELFYGGTYPTPILKTISKVSPARYALRANSIKLQLLNYKSNNETPPPFLNKQYLDRIKKMKLAKSGKLDSKSVKNFHQKGKFIPKKGFNKPIYFLVDRRCASSCEHTLEYFEAHPKRKVFGENTAGLIHFGDTGRLILPYSGIDILISVKYLKYKDGRFAERKGYTPDVMLKNGEDALDSALKDIQNRHKL
ncbi:MAG: hypothetical protein HON90_02080 [Halobacteriovoraceae bacterium]|nr:hypothetical protein [Halobacteriovoraceae bacterium]